MASYSSIPEPSRPTEIARLELSQLSPDVPLDRVFARACELSAHALNVERVGIWLFIDDRQALRCAELYEKTKNEHSSGALLRVADFPTYFASLTIRKAIPSEVAGNEPWTAELAAMYLRPLGIASMLDAGIFVEGELVGVLCHEHVGPPREWTTEARDFAGSVADLLALRIQSAEVREMRAAFLKSRDRLAHQDKAAALEKLAAGVAHDFRNLLTVFLSLGDRLSSRTDLPADARLHGQQIVNAAERGIELATELMDFARPAERRPSVLDVAAVLADLVPVLQALVGPRHEIRYTRPGPIGHALIDKTHFTRMVMNFAINAKEALPRGGPIDIHLSPVRLTGNASYSGVYIHLEVSDGGNGMDDATKRRAIEPYFSTKAKGTGLGLAIAQQIVERAGGVIRIESAVGQGTTIHVFLPRIGASSGGTMELEVPAELRPAENR
jgi:signal transduction histidine kinase